MRRKESYGRYNFPLTPTLSLKGEGDLIKAMKRITLKISGRVQGTGYRYASQQEAQKQGFTGYVCNLPDGSVELVAEGREPDLKNFIQWCYNGVGPAAVRTIETSWSEATGEFSHFLIKG